MHLQRVIIRVFATNFFPLLAQQENTGFCHFHSWPLFFEKQQNQPSLYSQWCRPNQHVPGAATSSRQSDRSLAFEWLARRWRHGRRRPPCTELRVHITVFTGSTEASNHVCCHGRPCSLCPAPCVTEHRNGIQRQCG